MIDCLKQENENLLKQIEDIKKEWKEFNDFYFSNESGTATKEVLFLRERIRVLS